METYSEIEGLSSAQVQEQKALGLVNTSFDNYSTTYLRIVLRNLFNIINVVIFPLLAVLAVFELYTAVLSFSTFLIINTLVSMIDEIRVKRQVDKLKQQFQRTAVVIRDAKKIKIPVAEVVKGDHVYGKEGEGIIADGTVIACNYLQVDESVLTGESNYIEKQPQERVLAGSFIVTGNCVYLVEEVGKNNYLNKLGNETLKFKSTKGSLQRNGDRVIAFLVTLAITLALTNLLTTAGRGIAASERLLSITTIVSLIIPQTLVFLFTLSFTVSIIKLYRKGVLVRKGGSIQELAAVDVICFDKTGTITTNDMKIVDVKTFGLDLNLVGSIYNAVKAQIVGITKTQELLHHYFGKFKPVTVTNFGQVPFTSKQKYSLISGEVNGKYVRLAFGAASVLLSYIQEPTRKQVEDYISQEEQAGNRVLVGLFSAEAAPIDPKQIPQSTEVIIFTIEETLNPGIDKLLAELTEQGIQVKIISGDSMQAVGRIAQKIGIPADQITDLSIDRAHLHELASQKSIFTRATPEDKVKIIQDLRTQGHRVAMIGDGINDVLAMKSANVSIAMESAARITHDTADIVLLHNDYRKVPMIFFEGDNIIFNLKLSTKIFLAKTLMGAFLAIIFSTLGQTMPFYPTATLIFSFLGSSAPSYILVFTRKKVNNSNKFFAEVFSTSIVNGFIFACCTVAFYNILIIDRSLTNIHVSTALVLLLLALSVIFSLYLSWESGKLRSWWSMLVLFVTSVTIGMYQTILPITKYAAEDRLKIILFTALGLAFLATVAYPLMRKWPLRRRLFTYGGVLIFVSFAFLFPFQEYYSVINLPLDVLKQVALMTFVGFMAIVSLNWLRRIVEKRWGI